MLAVKRRPEERCKVCGERAPAGPLCATCGDEWVESMECARATLQATVAMGDFIRARKAERQHRKKGGGA